ncbi:MAG: DNA repair protein RadA [Syntrophomonadaceae bacterium]|jgi:DNA repair protein RadA/Sms|nr:DNA repair protein RadA [Syntrophomonadaceae bacterium]
MTKTRTLYFCSECGYRSPKWIGRCPGCNSWNTLVEEVIGGTGRTSPVPEGKTPVLSELLSEDVPRFSSGNIELDRVLGGGMVPGSIILLGGEPGIGKSTLLLQAADSLSRQGRRVLYLTGEESPRQLKMRAERLGVLGDSIYVLNDSCLSALPGYLEKVAPEVVIVDSIQTVHIPEISSVPGSVAQLRECAGRILELAKTAERTFFLVGHVTKDGSLAGPKLLEHMVDTVIYFEGDTNNYYRILRTVKNRFGPANEIGILEMSGSGLLPVDNPSCIFLEHRGDLPGLTVVASFEGTRPLLVEVEALVVTTSIGYPRRMASGIESNRLALLAAVLEKRGGLALGNKDIYIKVAGGVNLKDPATDLGIALAIASSYYERPVLPGGVIIGELGLSGDIRPVPYMDLRMKEALKLGFSRSLTPKEVGREEPANPGLSVLTVETLGEALRYIDGNGGMDI